MYKKHKFRKVNNSHQQDQMEKDVEHTPGT